LENSSNLQDSEERSQGFFNFPFIQEILILVCATRMFIISTLFTDVINGKIGGCRDRLGG
jgi:hypothetical protein